MTAVAVLFILLGAGAVPCGVFVWLVRRVGKKGQAARWLWITLVGFVMFAIGIAFMPAAEPQSDAPRPTPEPTATPGPTHTPGPPTSTPEPTATPTPALLTARDIERKRSELTDLQWDKYTVDVIGEEIRFSGKVLEVYDDARVQISFASAKKLMTGGILHGLSGEQALALNKDQTVKGVGTVREVGVFLGLNIHIDVTALE